MDTVADPSVLLPHIASAATSGGKRPQSQANTLQIVTEDYASASVTSIKGLKPGNPNWTNQDNFLIIERFDNRDVNIYCVLDGHGEVRTNNTIHINEKIYFISIRSLHSMC